MLKSKSEIVIPAENSIVIFRDLDGAVYYKTSDGKSHLTDSYHDVFRIEDPKFTSYNNLTGEALKVLNFTKQEFIFSLTDISIIGGGGTGRRGPRGATGAAGSGSDILSQYTHVDAFSGDDATGAVRDFTKKFKTLDAAIAAVPINSRIWVWNGIYSVGATTNLYKRNITYYLSPGTSINRTSGANPLFNASAETATSIFSVFGYGIISDSAAGGIISTNNKVTEVNLEFNSLSSSNTDNTVDAIYLAEPTTLYINIRKFLISTRKSAFKIEGASISVGNYNVFINQLIVNNIAGDIGGIDGFVIKDIQTGTHSSVTINEISNTSIVPDYKNISIEGVSGFSNMDFNIGVNNTSSSDPSLSDGYGFFVEADFGGNNKINYFGDINYNGANQTLASAQNSALFFHNLSTSFSPTFNFKGDISGGLNKAILTPTGATGEAASNIFIYGNLSGADDNSNDTNGRVVSLKHNDNVYINGIITSTGTCDNNRAAVLMDNASLVLTEDGSIFNSATSTTPGTDGEGVFVNAGDYRPASVKIVNGSSATDFSIDAPAPTNIIVSGIVGTKRPVNNITNAITGSVLYTDSNLV